MRSLAFITGMNSTSDEICEQYFAKLDNLGWFSEIEKSHAAAIAFRRPEIGRLWFQRRHQRIQRLFDETVL
jgi:hypothetical protein